uniref:ISNCY family transposase n=1 Tax=Heligmosomoides polygyrus TaxID=6339 RepID=A0A8L8KJ36_HELPZ
LGGARGPRNQLADAVLQQNHERIKGRHGSEGRRPATAPSSLH